MLPLATLPKGSMIPPIRVVVVNRIVAVKGTNKGHIAAVPSPPAKAPPSAIKSEWGVVIGIGLTLGLACWAMLRELVVEKLPISSSGGEKEYTMALARTRQAVHVQRALVHAQHRDFARAVVELQFALKEHSLCRTPVITSNFSEEELLELYRISLVDMTPQVPPDYGLLLQVRQMLDLPSLKAEELEKKVLEKGGSFSI